MPWAEYDYSEPLPSAPAFHAKIAQLAPSLSTSQVLRVGMIAGACGLTLGAITVLALLTAQKPSVARVDGSSTVGHSNAAGRADAAATSVEPRESATAAEKRCNEQPWPYVDRNCSNPASGNPPPVRVITPSPVALHDGAPLVTQGATPALDGIKPSEEPQLPAASAPARDKKVRNKKRSRRRQDDTRSAYASHSGGHYDYGRRNDYSSRYDSVPRYLQERRPNPSGWSW
jgi:hypothetical protein